MTTAREMANLIQEGQNIVFLTGAGVSTPSGIPDYRSMDGVYSKGEWKEPTYLLSRRALLDDPVDFHQFIKPFYQREALPNVIHEKIAQLDQSKNVTVITQNIDGLHGLAGSQHVIEFHGTLATCHCETCKQPVEVEDFLQHLEHVNCGGLVRPDIVLYDEQIILDRAEQTCQALTSADTLVIVGTSFSVYPFSTLLYYATKQAKILVINQTSLFGVDADTEFLGDATQVFELL